MVCDSCGERPATHRLWFGGLDKRGQRLPLVDLCDEHAQVARWWFRIDASHELGDYSASTRPLAPFELILGAGVAA